MEKASKKDEEDDPFSTSNREETNGSSNGLGKGLDVEIKAGSGGGLFGSEIAKLRDQKNGTSQNDAI